VTEIQGLGIPGQYGLFLADEDPKKGVWLDPAKTLEHYLLRENVRTGFFVISNYVFGFFHLHCGECHFVPQS
jgi:hypothetical protein